jgi:hypothetical protein
MVLPIISSTPLTYLANNYGIGTKNLKTYDENGVQKNFVVATNISGNDSKTTYDYISEARTKTLTNLTSTLDIGGQISSTFKNIADDENTYSQYGMISDRDYILSPKNDLISLIKEGKFYPSLFLPNINTNWYDGSITVSYIAQGATELTYFAQSLLGNKNSIGFMGGGISNTILLDADDIKKVNDINFVNYIIDKYL